ncbi:hypothetical protein PAXRUDRAFT_159850, partial [Paxillus rubicundulus Ve08.2h10]
KFASKISCVHIDEAYNVYTAGLPHHGEEAFWPAYSCLGEFQIILPKGTPFQALSTTLPPHILAVLKHELNIPPNHIEVRLSTNHPNTTYCTIPIVGGLHEFCNLNCLIPPQFHPPMEIPKTLIFHDCKQDATNATIYICEATEAVTKSRDHQTLPQ